jgi:hypothetical protein
LRAYGQRGDDVTLSIRYELVGTGWSQCTVCIAEEEAVLTASYLSDALGSLAGATLNLLRGSQLERARFEEEPGEYRWVLKQFCPGELSVRILEFEDYWEGNVEESGVVLLRGTCSVSDFARAVLEALDGVLAEHGEHGYKKKWAEHAFPRELREQIRAALVDAV